MNFSDFFNSNCYATDEDTTSGDIATVDAPIFYSDDPVSLADSDNYDPALEGEEDVCPHCGQGPCVCGEGSDDFEDGEADIVADSEDDDEDDFEDDFEDDDYDSAYKDAYQAGYDAAVGEFENIPDVDECGAYDNDYDLNLDQ